MRHGTTAIAIAIAMLVGVAAAAADEHALDCSSGTEKTTKLTVSKQAVVFNTQDKKSLVFMAPGRSQVTASFDLAEKPGNAILALTHLSAGAKTKFGGHSVISVRINGEPFLTELEVGSHGHSADRFVCSKLLKKGPNTVSVKFAKGSTTYWLQRLAIELKKSPPLAKAKHAWFADWSGGSRKTNMEVAQNKLVFNTQDKKSIVFFQPGASQLGASFDLPVKASKAWLEMAHLSAGVGGARFGGDSQISIHINGEQYVRSMEIGSHGHNADRLVIDKMLKAGRNTVTVRMVGGRATYWLSTLRVRCEFPEGTDLAGKVRRIPADGKAEYAVVVSKRTYADASWKAVVDALVEKHEAVVIEYPVSVGQVLAELTKVHPRHTCFVARPTETGRQYVIDIHRMTRRLDADPYTDTRWGIITGYTSKTALRIARHATPLKVRRASAGCGISLTSFLEGVWYSETKKNQRTEKKAGGEPTQGKCPDDTTASIVAELNSGKPDFFVTSGHATQHDWQIGYAYKNGQFRCKDGQLFGLDTSGRRHPINSPNPKVYSGSGNCLMGLIDSKQTMALAWMGSAGVNQMIGYVVSTFFGYGGHGVNDYFIGSQGRLSYAESFFLNNQALVARLQREFQSKAKVNFDQWHIETDNQLPNKLAARFGLRARDAIGLLWDRDTVALYGDPKWEARVARAREPDRSVTLTESGGTFTLTVTSNTKGKWGRPAAALLPYRVRRVQITRGLEHKPVITDDFILLPSKAEHAKGEVLKVVFKAERR